MQVIYRGKYGDEMYYSPNLTIPDDKDFYLINKLCGIKDKEDIYYSV